MRHSGKSGNIPALAIDQVLGSSVYVRNLAAFTGGRDAYSVKFVTAQDTQRAVSTARHLLAAEAIGLHYPCLETITRRCRRHLALPISDVSHSGIYARDRS